MISTFKCEKCEDTGFICFTDSEGHFMAKECECKKRRVLESRLRSSGITVDEFESKSFETFVANTDETKKMLEMANKFLEDIAATGIGYFGKSGTGKTHICIAICQKLIKEQNRNCRYFSYRVEMQKLLQCYYQDSYWFQINDLTDVEVLYIDDLLKFAKSNKGNILENELRILYDIINMRYVNKKVTIFSSEYSVKEIIEIDEALGSRIYSMVRPYGMFCTGVNRRMKE